MNCSIAVMVLSALVLCASAFSQTPVAGAFTGASGNPLINAKVIKFDGENFVVEHDGGISSIPWNRAPEAVRAKYTRRSAAVAAAPPANFVTPPSPPAPKAAPARERKFARYNIAFMPPDGWEPLTTPPGPTSFQMTFVSPDQLRLVIVTADDRRTWKAMLDDQGIADWELGAQSKGGKKPIWSKKLAIEGRPAYQRMGTTPVGEMDALVLVMVVFDDGVSYNLLAMRRDDEEPGKDADTQKFFSSFRFLNAPGPALP
jgi:hypothetical protein